ncbi:unnamed protein product [Didymodactylos carnosus]|uniref:F-box domain-containing protein n=2 Tax=Didymodactylos carnosus TaxID=1234261 RepID=A0A8S2Q4D0_9BILA|nr:unnamed protein product [Didymodactylos carnosus]CAF4084176.1 unnamed protein product [Didymodactylos carnosus]
MNNDQIAFILSNLYLFQKLTHLNVHTPPGSVNGTEEWLVEPHIISSNITYKYNQLKLQILTTSFSTSSTIEYLTIDHYDIHQLEQLFSKLPKLKYFSCRYLHLTESNSQIQFNQQFRNILHLKIQLKPNIKFDHIQLVLKNLPQLKCLELIAYENEREQFIDACQWEILINTYLKQLKKFKFLFFIYRTRKLNHEILKPFTNDFWLYEKKWFVVCDYHIYNKYTFLYTTPYINTQFDLIPSETFETNSTLPLSCLSNIYINVNKLKVSFHTPIPSNRYYSNVKSLTLGHIENNQTTYDELNNFVQLSIINHAQIEYDISVDLFSNIIINGHNLCSLKISYHRLSQLTNNFTNKTLCSHLNEKIKKLNLTRTHYTLSINHIKNLCFLFSNLEQLIFRIKFKHDLPFILEELKHLFYIRIQCYGIIEQDIDDIRQWLSETNKNFFCTTTDYININIWIN